MREESLRQFREAMQTAGIRPPAEIKTDGQLHRFCNSDRHRDQSGWYVFYPDGVAAGAFGDWRLGIKQDWRTKLNRPLNDFEQMDYQKKIVQIQQAHAAVEKQRAFEAAKQAEKIWGQSSLANNNHPYLTKKGVQVHGIREYKSQLVIPIQQGQTIHSLQFISMDGTKRFLNGGRVQGGYFKLGDQSNSDIICLCEGYATGASLFEATGYPVVITFHAGNLKSVAQSLRDQYPQHRLVIGADDDESTKGNPGLSMAKETAALVNGFLAIPVFGTERPPKASDFNDLHRLSGLEAVRKIIYQVLQAPTATNTELSRRKRRYTTTSRQMKQESQDWIWADWLTAGDLHLLAGAPGTGKTTIAMNIAATISRGGIWPDGSHCKAGHVLIWSSEDHHCRTLLPCLLAHHHDRERVHFINLEIESEVPGGKPQLFDPAHDLVKIEDEVRALGDVRLIIIDPIVDAIDADSHKNAEVRRALWPLMSMARHLNAAILGISHFSKGLSGHPGFKSLEWVTGSMAFGAFARSVWLAVETTDFAGQITDRLLVRTKSNLMRYTPGCGYSYNLESTQLSEEDGLITRSVLWKEPVLGIAEHALKQATNQGFAQEHSTLEEAMDFLKDLLVEGPIAKKDIDVKAEQSGFSAITIRRAKTALGIKPTRDGYGMGGVWKWALPSNMLNAIKEAPGRGESIFKSEEEQLRDLLRCHPEMVEGCKRSDILAHAIPEDYEDLKDRERFALFARHLRDTHQIPCSEVQMTPKGYKVDNPSTDESIE